MDQKFLLVTTASRLLKVFVMVADGWFYCTARFSIALR